MERSTTSFKSQKSPRGLHGNDTLVTVGINVIVLHNLLVAAVSFRARPKTQPEAFQTRMIAEGCLRKNVRHQSISTVCHSSMLGNTGKSRCSIRFDGCWIDSLFPACHSCSAVTLNRASATLLLKTSSHFPCESRRWKMLPRRPGILMLLPPLTTQRSDCSTEVVHSSNSLSMFNSSSFKCFLVPRQCFNSHDSDADGCRTGPVEHFNDPQTLRSRASYWGRTHLNNHCHQFPGNVMRQCKVLAC